MPVSPLPSEPFGDAMTASSLPRPPLDVVLVLDRSASMTPDRLPHLKRGARHLVDLLLSQPGDIRVGLVTFSTAAASVPLTNRANELRAAIDRIRARGAANHTLALKTAQSLFSLPSGSRRIVLLFTDGPCTGPEDPELTVHTMKATGTELYAIGLGRELPPLERWASHPAEDHVRTTCRASRLPELFTELGTAFLCPPGPTPLPRPEGGDCCPPLPGCCPKPCPKPEACSGDVCFRVRGCQNTAVVDLPDQQLTSLGRVLYLNVTLRNVCPNKRLAVAVTLWEVDCHGHEQPRGMRCFTVPAQTGQLCRDLELTCIRFVVPEDLNSSCGCCSSHCRSRCFRASVMANYIDTDVVSCEPAVTVL